MSRNTWHTAILARLLITCVCLVAVVHAAASRAVQAPGSSAEVTSSSGRAPLPPMPMHRYLQHFDLRKPLRVSGVSIRMATYLQSGLQGVLTVELRDASGRTLAKSTQPAATIVDDAMHAFPFPDGRVLVPGTYALAIHFDPKGEKRPLTAWSLPGSTNQSVDIDGHPSGTRLDYQLDVAPIGSVHRPAFALPRPGGFGGQAWIVLLGGLLLASSYAVWRFRHRMSAPSPPGKDAASGMRQTVRAGPFDRLYRVVFCSALLGLYLWVLIVACGFSDADNIWHDLARVGRPCLELGLVAVACALCARRLKHGGGTMWAVSAVGMAGLVLVAYLAQSYSLWLSNNFISVLALQNTDSAEFVDSSPLLVSGAAAGLAWLGVFSWGIARAARLRPPLCGFERLSGPWLGALALGLLLANAVMLPLAASDGRLEPGDLQVPLGSLLATTWQARFAADESALVLHKAAPGALSCLNNAPAPRNPLYPFEHSEAFVTDSSDSPAWAPPAKTLNAIVIFTEGTSARLLGAYGGTNAGLTPHIDALARRSMRVTRYFNHTAATYRGLIGQLSSGYPQAGGGGAGGWETGADRDALARVRRRTLAMILRDRGYQTYFFSPHKRQRIFTTMLGTLGFDRIYTYQSISRDLLQGRIVPRKRLGALSDHSLFDGLVAFLKDRAAAGVDRPFFVATYNIGTHAFIGIGDKGVPYGDGSSPVLNKLHNYDDAVGQFLDYFRTSPFAENTLLIFTSDHATYPEADYRKVAGPAVRPYFVDTIPLLVDDPQQHLPATLDAHGRTSLDLAPTVLQLLGIRHTDNSFLGNSLFGPSHFPEGMAAIGGQFFLTTDDGVLSAGEIPPALRDDFACESAVVRTYYEAELENRLFR